MLLLCRDMYTVRGWVRSGSDDGSGRGMQSPGVINVQRWAGPETLEGSLMSLVLPGAHANASLLLSFLPFALNWD